MSRLAMSPEQRKVSPTDQQTNCDDQLSPGSQKVLTLNDSKAGMEGLDLKKINSIIEETSKGSKFYEHKKQRQRELKQKVQNMAGQLAKLSPDSILKSQKEVDARVEAMEVLRDMSRIIVHVDMDAFFASVEMRDNPSLRDVPMAVGGQHMLSTSNYQARRFGVRAAMPGFIAKKLCPNLIIVPPNFHKYEAASKEVEEVLKEYDKETLSMSLDEANLDITKVLADRNKNSEGLQVTAEDLVQEMRKKIHEKTNLTASAGIAPNAFLAKICSDINKPNNQFSLESKTAAVVSFLSTFPIRKVCGIGPVSEEMLKGIGISTVGELFEKRAIVNLLFKPAQASFLLSASLGIGGSFFSFAQEGSDDGGRKSFSCERTFGKGTKEDLKELLKDISEQVEEYLQRRGIMGKTITLKIKTITFEVKTRARTITDYTSNAKVIFDTAWSIYQSYENEISDLKLRLIGIRISTLRDTNDVEEGEKSTDSKKQKTILEMFNKTIHQPVKIYSCPACTNEFNSAETFHKHVNDCLETLEKPQNDAVIEKSEDPTPSSSTCVKKEHPNTNPDTNTSSGSSINMIICPVCNGRFNSHGMPEKRVEELMNAHLDECLNLIEAKKMLKEDSNVIPSPTATGANSVNATSADNNSHVGRTLSSSTSNAIGTTSTAIDSNGNPQTPKSAKRKNENIVILRAKGNNKKKKQKILKCNAIESYFKPSQ